MFCIIDKTYARAKAQAIRNRPLSVETRVRRWASSCVTCDTQCRIGIGFLQVIRSSPVRISPVIASY
jgi:hypothetical protein